MAGILDSKERVMDFIITQEGRRQAGIGGLKAHYATFTDMHAVYDTSGSLEMPELAADASSKIYFEAYNRFQDVVVPELEPGASMRPFRTKNFQVASTNMISLATGTFTSGADGNYKNVLSGREIKESAITFLDDIETNFVEQRIIGTKDEFALGDGAPNFRVTPTTGTLANLATFDGYTRDKDLILENAPNLFFDSRFSHFPNFMYLPPTRGGGENQQFSKPMGSYADLVERDPVYTPMGGDIQDIIDRLATNAQDNSPIKIQFPQTSQNNNLIIQLFDMGHSGVRKLDCVDYGEFIDPATNTSKRIVFLGRLLKDSSGAMSFICIFTLVFNRGEPDSLINPSATKSLDPAHAASISNVALHGAFTKAPVSIGGL